MKERRRVMVLAHRVLTVGGPLDDDWLARYRQVAAVLGADHSSPATRDAEAGALADYQPPEETHAMVQVPNPPLAGARVLVVGVANEDSDRFGAARAHSGELGARSP